MRKKGHKRFLWPTLSMASLMLAGTLLSKFSFLSHATLVPGKVTSIGTQSVWGGRSSYDARYPIIAYRYKGRQRTYSKPRELLLNMPGIGDEVRIAINEHNPSDVRLYRFFGFWLTTTELTLLLLLPAAIAGIADVMVMLWRAIAHRDYE